MSSSTNLSDLIKETQILALIVYGSGEGLPLKDVLELSFTSKPIYEAVSKNNDVWKHFFTRYNLEVPSNPTLASFISEYNSKSKTKEENNEEEDKSTSLPSTSETQLILTETVTTTGTEVGTTTGGSLSNSTDSICSPLIEKPSESPDIKSESSPKEVSFVRARSDARPKTLAPKRLFDSDSDEDPLDFKKDKLPQEGISIIGSCPQTVTAVSASSKLAKENNSNSNTPPLAASAATPTTNTTPTSQKRPVRAASSNSVRIDDQKKRNRGWGKSLMAKSRTAEEEEEKEKEKEKEKDKDKEKDDAKKSQISPSADFKMILDRPDCRDIKVSLEAHIKAFDKQTKGNPDEQERVAKMLLKMTENTMKQHPLWMKFQPDQFIQAKEEMHKYIFSKLYST